MSEQESQGIAGLNGSPKTMFYLGLTTGVGVTAIVVLGIALSIVMKGGSLGAWGGANAPLAAAPNAPVAPTDPTQPLPPAGPVAPVDADDHVRGNPNAKVTMIEYSDFECPFCLRHLDTIDQILAQYPNDVKLVYRHFPLTSLHPEAQKAAEASECAGAQGKFWEMHDKIFEANAAGAMSVQRWKDDAKALGLNATQFNNCLDNGDMVARVAQDVQEGSTAGVGGTPGTFVNGSLVEGAVPLANFQQIVQQSGAQS